MCQIPAHSGQAVYRHEVLQRNFLPIWLKPLLPCKLPALSGLLVTDSMAFT